MSHGRDHTGAGLFRIDRKARTQSGRHFGHVAALVDFGPQECGGLIKRVVTLRARVKKHHFVTIEVADNDGFEYAERNRVFHYPNPLGPKGAVEMPAVVKDKHIERIGPRNPTKLLEP